jgi:hypothetical protein
MIVMYYRQAKDGPVKELRFDDSRLDEILKRCEDKFCAPLTAEDLMRFDKIVSCKKARGVSR